MTDPLLCGLGPGAFSWATSRRAAEWPRFRVEKEAGRRSICVLPLSTGSKWLAGTSTDGALDGRPPLSIALTWCLGGSTTLDGSADLTKAEAGRNRRRWAVDGLCPRNGRLGEPSEFEPGSSIKS